MCTMLDKTMNFEEVRLKSFEHWDISYINKSDPALLGFYWLKQSDFVKCVFLQCRNWNVARRRQCAG